MFFVLLINITSSIRTHIWSETEVKDKADIKECNMIKWVRLAIL